MEFTPSSHRQKYCCLKHYKAEKNAAYREKPGVKEELARKKRELRASQGAATRGPNNGRSLTKPKPARPRVSKPKLSPKDRRLVLIRKLARKKAK